MRKKSIFAIIIAIVMMLGVYVSTRNMTESEELKTAEVPTENSEKIYLYGEWHGVEKILDKEFELWKGYYDDQGMRHLFVELPYYTAEYMNLWMQSDNDDILYELYEDTTGTASNKPCVNEFYKKIKAECPETVFHGTDVGHQFESTGERYLEYLKNNNLEDTEQYKLTQAAIEQGKAYYRAQNDVYRENTMVENFVREFDKLDGESIMGIYGAAHTGVDKLDFSNSVPCMANQLNEHYKDMIVSEDISWIAKDLDPSRVDMIEVNGKEYRALYYGEEDLTGFRDYSYRKFWRLVNAFDDFKEYSKSGDVLPYQSYPMLIEEGQAFRIDYVKTDGSVIRRYGISDGHIWNDMPSTEEVIVPSEESSEKIYLYGEAHGEEKILDKEFELWQGYYNDQGMRHLFVELPYYTAEYMNLWMQSDNDDILNQIYEDWRGTANYKLSVKTFYEKIKKECPETVFHGTDVGHQYESTGERYLEYLESNDLKESEEFLLGQLAIEQGKRFYEEHDAVYRENKMVENFASEFSRLDGESIMGIYGAAHTGLGEMDYTNSVPCMANQLNEEYYGMIVSEDISWIAKDISPIRVDTIEVNGKEFEASYFGKKDMTGFKDFSYRECWRLENAFGDFKDNSKNGNVLPYDNFPMNVTEEQVFIIDFGKIDGSVERVFYISNGHVWNNMPSAVEVVVE